VKRVGAAGYGIDLRERIVAALDQGGSTKAVAERYDVGCDTVRLYAKKAQAGTLAQRAQPSGRRRTVQAEHEQVLLTLLQASPDATLEEHAQLLQAATGLLISYRTVDRVFRRHGITYKKNTGRSRTE
jgi:transposase